MNEEDRSLIRKALDKLSRSDDPVRDGLSELVAKHGRTAVAKAASEFAEPDLSDLSEDELAELQRIQQEPDPLEERLAALEQKIDGLSSASSKTESEEPPTEVPEDELALVKSGVPVERIEELRPALRSSDEDAKRAAYAMLAKSADPKREALLAKEHGSSQIPDEDSVKQTYLERLAKADGVHADDRPDAKALLRRLAEAAE